VIQRLARPASLSKRLPWLIYIDETHVTRMCVRARTSESYQTASPYTKNKNNTRHFNRIYHILYSDIYVPLTACDFNYQRSKYATACSGRNILSRAVSVSRFHVPSYALYMVIYNNIYDKWLYVCVCVCILSILCIYRPKYIRCLHLFNKIYNRYTYII
jgi:hypothetical protein